MSPPAEADVPDGGTFQMRPAQKIHVLKHRFFSKMSHKIRYSNGAVQIFHETLTPACKACRLPTNAVRDAASGALTNLAKNYECLHPPRPPHSGLGSPSPRRVGPVRRPRHARRSSRPDRKRRTIFVTTNANTVVYSAAVQADGKIILGGSFTTVAGVARNRMRDSTQTGPLTPPSTPMPPTP